MSLPTAPKDISTNPKAGSVVDPVNKADKDADVNRKIKLFGVVQAFRQGRMPSNAQIDTTLKYVLDNSPVEINKLSPDGQKLIQDIRDIISTARQLVLDKNADELFQQFVWHTRDVDYDAAKKDPNQVLPVDKTKAKDDGQQAVQHLRTLLSLILTNSEVRKLASDLSLIGRDLLSRSLQKGAGAVAPHPDKLARVDEAGPRDQFITEGGRAVGPDETPVLEARVPGTGHTVAQHPKDPLGSGAKVTTEDGRVRSGDQAYAEGRNAAQDIKAEGLQKKEEIKREGQAQADLVRAQAPNSTNGKIDAAKQAKADVVDGENPEAEAKKQGLFDRMRGVRDGLLDRVPQEHKDRANDQYDRGREFLTEEYFPEERRDQFIYRLKKVVIECQKHSDYQDSIRWLIGYVEEYANHAQTVGGHGGDSAAALKEDVGLRQTVRELRTLLERFANGKTLDPVIHSVDVLIEDTKRDQELREWFKEVDAYVRKVLLDAGYVLEPDCNNRANALRESGRRFYDDKYKSHFDNLFDTTGAWFRAMGDDPLNARFGEDWARLTKDLLFDSEGSLKFKSQLWNDIRKVILPTLIDQVGYIPIPRIEYTDDSLDLVVENLTLSGRNLFPNVVSLEAHNFVKFSPYNAITDESKHDFTFTFGQIQADMRDVAFYFRKKSGIPKLTDSGLADVVLGGEGLTATVQLVSAGKDRSSVFKVKHVNVKVDTLKFSIRDSKHDFLYKTLKPLATGLVKKQIQKAIEDAIRTGFEYVDGQLVGVRDRMEEANRNEGESRTKALQELFHKKKEDASIKTQETANARHSQFKVVSNKRDSLLAQEGHPAGWVNRTAEKEQLAGKGTEWRSDAFNIV